MEKNLLVEGGGVKFNPPPPPPAGIGLRKCSYVVMLMKCAVVEKPLH